MQGSLYRFIKIFLNCNVERFYEMTDLAVSFLHRLSGQGESWLSKMSNFFFSLIADCSGGIDVVSAGLG